MLLRLLIISGAALGFGLTSGVGAIRAQGLPTQAASVGGEVVPLPTAETTRSQPAVFHSGWGAIQNDGTLKGRVVTIGAAGAVKAEANASVTLSQDLIMISTTRTSADGSFALSGLSPGVYEIAAESPNCYAIVSFQAISAGDLSSAPVMEVYASSMLRPNVDEVLQSLWAPQEIEGNVRPFEEMISPLRPATQSQRVAIRGGAVSGEVAFANPRNVAEAHVIKVFRQGKLLATAPVDSSGKFSFPASSAGPVDLVLGGSAYASLGVELVDDSRMTAAPRGNVRLVSLLAAAVATQLVVPAVGGPPPGLPGEPLPPPPLPLAVGPPIPMGGGMGPMGGGFGGGFGGGVGGGGGGLGGLGGGLGGIGGLLGIGGLAVGIAALADDDDGFTVPIGTRVVNTQ